MIIGLTGGIGSGKTTILELFKTMGNIAVYNADIEAKKLMNSSKIIKKRISDKFGRESYKEGILNREYLAKIVFPNKKKLQDLNKIVHPEVFKHLHEFIVLNKNKKYIIYENAILFENNSDRICDYIITILADKELRIKRIMDRDLATRQDVLNRMKNQWNDTKKILQSNYIIEHYNLENTKYQIKVIHNKLKTKN